MSVTDANSCPAAVSSDIIIVNPAELVITSEASTDITCHDYDNGTIEITINGKVIEPIVDPLVMCDGDTNSSKNSFRGQYGG